MAATPRADALQLMVDRRRAQQARLRTGAVDPRVNRSRETALEAARTLLLNEGWNALSQQRVAEAAGIGRATVYRLWPHRIELLHDVCAREIQILRVAPTADLAADLLAQIESKRAALVDRRLDAVVIALADRSRYEPLMREVKVSLVRNATENLRDRIAKATADGELAADVDVGAAVAALVGPMVYRRIFADEDVTTDQVRQTVADFLAPRSRGSTAQAPPGG
jgi:AcrR family transcriptional regulator